MSASSLAFYWLLVIISAAALPALADERGGERQALKYDIVDDLTRASRLAEVRLSKHSIKAFMDSATTQQDEYLHAYNNVSRDTRVTRLATYLKAKSIAQPDFSSTGGRAADISDFHWGYVAKDFSYSPVRLSYAKSDKFAISTLEYSGRKYSFGRELNQLAAERAVLLPQSKNDTEDKVTLVFDIGKSKVLWTGESNPNVIAVMRASTTQGSEIHVNSEPRGASVYFNQVRWHRPTNTKTVHDPGKFEVVIRLPGFSDWRVERSLGPGDIWTINAILVKQH